MKMTQTPAPKPPSAIRGLYAITPDMVDTGRLCQLVEASLKGGAAVIQYRNKTADAALRLEQARRLLAPCRSYGVPLIINDHLDLCLALGADGLHLGGEDGDIKAARQALGNKLLGVSCYNRFELAVAAKARGADYVAFGSCFDSATKPAAVHAPLALLTQAARELHLPVVAIGGVTQANAPLAIGAGADSIAVIGALFTAVDVQQAASQFSNLFK
ncbi:MAG TPA: thiamine phosphate synthase [Methylophilaceae bacterium]|nr:thiamine phosphate synthase [Methylophilaceae bacterium]